MKATLQEITRGGSARARPGWFPQLLWPIVCTHGLPRRLWDRCSPYKYTVNYRPLMWKYLLCSALFVRFTELWVNFTGGCFKKSTGEWNSSYRPDEWVVRHASAWRRHRRHTVRACHVSPNKFGGFLSNMQHMVNFIDNCVLLNHVLPICDINAGLKCYL